MENQNFQLSSNTVPTLQKLSWLLIGLSATSSIMRTDFNIVYGYVILIILAKYYYLDSKLFLKIILHCAIALSGFDLLWFIVSMSSWTSKEGIYWKSLYTMHWVVIIISFIELIVKCLIGYLAYNEFMKLFSSDYAYLTKFDYRSNKKENEGDNDKIAQNYIN